MADIELPTRGAGGAGRRRGLNLPTVADVPQARVASDPGVRMPNFGGGGEALVEGGKAIMGFGTGVDLAVQRQQKMHDATETTSASLAFDRLGMEEFNRLQTEDDPSRPEFERDYEKWLVGNRDKVTGKIELGGKAKDILDNLPAGVSQEAKDKLRLKLESSGNGMVDAAARTSLIAGQKKAMDVIGRQVNQWSAQAARDPDFYETILAQVGDETEGLGQFKGSLTPDQERDVLTKARSSVLESTVSGFVSADRYGDAEKLLKSGKYDADIDPQTMARMNADISRGKRVAASEVAQLSNDHLASIENTGAGIPGLASKAQKVMDPKMFSEFAAREKVAKQTFDVGREIVFATPQEMVAKVETMKPKSGSTSFADEQRAYDGVQRKAATLMKARAEDPAGYVLAMPDVKKVWDAAQNDPLAGPAYAAKSIAAQTALGIAEPDRRVLPEAVAKGIVHELMDPRNAEKAADTIETMSRQFGPYWGQAYRDLVKEKLPGEFIALGTLDGPRDGPARKQLAEAMKVGRKMLVENLPDKAKDIVDKGVESSLTRWSQAELARGSTDRNVAAIRSSAELLAYHNVARGMSPSDAASQAAKAMIDDRYDVLDGPGFAIYTPKGAGAIVELNGRQIMSELKADQLATPLPRPGEKLTDAERREMYLGAVQRGRWVLNENGTGAQLLDQEGQPVMVRAEAVPDKSKFDAESSNYDEAGAKAAGLTRDKTGHMGSVVPASPADKSKFDLPDDSYMLLKGRKHETWGLAVKAEQDRGSEVVKRGDRYFSIPKGSASSYVEPPQQQVVSFRPLTFSFKDMRAPLMPSGGMVDPTGDFRSIYGTGQ